MTKLLLHIMKRELDLLYHEPQRIADIDVSYSISPVDIFQKVSYASDCAQKSVDLATLLSVIHQNLPDAQRTSTTRSSLSPTARLTR